VLKLYDSFPYRRMVVIAIVASVFVEAVPPPTVCGKQPGLIQASITVLAEENSEIVVIFYYCAGNASCEARVNTPDGPSLSEALNY
jgi:hypothetical protein